MLQKLKLALSCALLAALVGVATGTLALPAIADVRVGGRYAASGTEFTGTLTGGTGGGNSCF